MITLNLTVTENHIQTSGAPLLTSGCVNAVRCVFAFDDTWAELAKTASFESPLGVYHVQIENNECILPNASMERASAVYIGVIGTKQDYTITTDKVRFRISEGANKDGTIDPDYDPTLIEQLLDIADRTEASVQTLEERILHGDIKQVNSVGVESVLSRYGRTIHITQNGSDKGSFACIGKQSGQSWYITDTRESTVSGDFSAMLGFRNSCFGNGNVVCGINNDINGRGVLAGGINNTVWGCAEGALIAGRDLCLENSEVIFALGLPGDGRIVIYTNGSIEYSPPGGEGVYITPEKMWEVFSIPA